MLTARVMGLRYKSRIKHGSLSDLEGVEDLVALSEFVIFRYLAAIDDVYAKV